MILVTIHRYKILLKSTLHT